MSRIFCLHGVPKKIVSDRGTQSTSRFWKRLHESMDTKLNFSSAYHLQTDGQTKRTNQVLEDRLRACALKHGRSWDKSLPYTEFSYNNTYQASLKWHHLKHFTDESVEHHFIGIRLKKVKYLVQKFSKKQESKYRLSERM